MCGIEILCTYRNQLETDDGQSRVLPKVIKLKRKKRMGDVVCGN